MTVERVRREPGHDAWASPGIVSTVFVPRLAACVEPEFLRVRFAAQVRAHTASVDGAAGTIRVAPLVSDVSAEEPLKVLITPGLPNGATFRLDDSATEAHYLNVPEASNSSLHTVVVDTGTELAGSAELGWEFSGYGPLGGRVKITVFQGDDVLTTWRNPEGEW